MEGVVNCSQERILAIAAVASKRTIASRLAFLWRLPTKTLDAGDSTGSDASGPVMRGPPMFAVAIRGLALPTCRTGKAIVQRADCTGNIWENARRAVNLTRGQDKAHRKNQGHPMHPLGRPAGGPGNPSVPLAG